MDTLLITHTTTRKEVFSMSYKELAKNLIDQIPDSKMYYIVAYFRGLRYQKTFPMLKHWMQWQRSRK